MEIKILSYQRINFFPLLLLIRVICNKNYLHDHILSYFSSRDLKELCFNQIHRHLLRLIPLLKGMVIGKFDSDHSRMILVVLHCFHSQLHMPYSSKNLEGLRRSPPSHPNKPDDVRTMMYISIAVTLTSIFNGLAETEVVDEEEELEECDEG